MTVRRRLTENAIVVGIFVLMNYFHLHNKHEIQFKLNCILVLFGCLVYFIIGHFFPNYWAQYSRSCEDSGFLYGILLMPMVLTSTLSASHILYPEKDENDSNKVCDIDIEGQELVGINCTNNMSEQLLVVLNSSIVCSFASLLFVLVECLLRHSFQIRIQFQSFFFSFVAFIMVILASLSTFVLDLPFDVSQAIVSVYLFYLIVVIGRVAMKRSFTIGEALFVAQIIAVSSADLGFLFVKQFIYGFLCTEGDTSVRFQSGNNFCIAIVPLFTKSKLFVRRDELTVVLQCGILGCIWLSLFLSPFFSNYAHPENETAQVDPRIPGSQNLRPRNSTLGKGKRKLSIDAQPIAIMSPCVSILQWDSLPPKVSAALYVAMLSFLLLVVAPILQFMINENPIIWVANFTMSRNEHIFMLMYWVIALAIGLPIIHKISQFNVSLIIVRKLYHLQALFMFAPAIAITPEFLALSFGLASAVFLGVEYIRICRLPPLGAWFNEYLRSYTDSRDEGTVILTHFYLLTGCALPLWCFMGVIILGAGDAAGAIVGSTYGKIRCFESRKTLEGTLSAIAATIGCGLIISKMMGIDSPNLYVATVVTCLIEAHTKQIDNLILPAIFMVLLTMNFNEISFKMIQDWVIS